VSKETANRVLIAFAWICLVLSTAGWPVSAFTWAKEEPQFVLGLSWFAIIQGSFIFLVQSYIKKGQDENNQS
jgi:hypothetical protein